VELSRSSKISIKLFQKWLRILGAIVMKNMETLEVNLSSLTGLCSRCHGTKVFLAAGVI